VTTHKTSKPTSREQKTKTKGKPIMATEKNKSKQMDITKEMSMNGRGGHL